MHLTRHARPSFLALTRVALAIGLLLIGPTHDASAATFTVTSTLDEPDTNPGDGHCVSTPSGACTLRAAIMEANGQGGSHSITLPAGIFTITRAGANEDGGATGDLDIFATLTITGAGANSTIIDGNQIDNVLDVHAGAISLALSGLTVRNGLGDGVHMVDSSLSVTSSTISDNKGAGVVCPSSTATVAVTVTDSAIRSNGQQGLFCNAASGQRLTVSVTRGTIESNGAAGIDGGSGAPFGGASVVSVIQSRLDNNRIGITASTVTVTDSTIDNNGLSRGMAAVSGGIVGGTVTVNNSTIANNAGAGTDFTNGGAGISGGSVTVTDSTVTGNRGAEDEDIGGGIGGSNVIVTTSQITVNSAGLGGGIRARTLTLTSSTVSGNTATRNGRGGGVYVGVGGDSTITDSVITNNVGSPAGDTTFAVGGGIFFTNQGTLTITKSTIRENSIVGHGLGAGLAINGALPLTLQNTTVSGNHTPGSGGGAYVGAGGTLTATGTTFSGNSADGPGGGVFLADGASTLGTIINSTFSGNAASLGAGLYQAGAGKLQLTNATIAKNAAASGGGGLYKVNGTVEVKNTILAFNTGNANCFRTTPLTSLGNNIDSDTSCGFNGPNDLSNTDPKLGPLANNGGPTLTMALLSGSPAIDRGNDSFCPATDQRGISRPQDGDGAPPATCDIGAFEAAANTTPPPTTCTPRPPVGVTSAPDGNGGLRVTVSTSGTGGALSALQFGAASNAQITAPGAPPNATGNFNVSPPPGATSFTFTVRRATAGQATQVPFRVVDACGGWPTFVGGGPTAF